MLQTPQAARPPLWDTSFPALPGSFGHLRCAPPESVGDSVHTAGRRQPPQLLPALAGPVREVLRPSDKLLEGPNTSLLQ